jgi:type IV pilus assembly protein PilM
MQRTHTSRTDSSGAAAHVGSILSRAFPTPKMLAPRAAGIDISDSSIKWIVFKRSRHGHAEIEAWGHESLEEGIIVSGVVSNVESLAQSLRELKKKLPMISCAHSALPEESAFVFEMVVPNNSSREHIRNTIEFELENRVPIAPSAAIYDFDRIPSPDGEEQEIGVAVFPRDLAEGYAEAFETAGISLLSLEIEARSTARAISHDSARDPVTLLVDFGLKRTGFSVLKYGIPIFTSTVEIGGDVMTRALMEKLKLTAEEAEHWKNYQGLVPDDGPKSPGLEAISGAASALGSEVARYYHYWDTRRDDKGQRMSPVSRVMVVGGSANLKGFADYIAGRVQAPVERPDVWGNILNLEEYIPPIDRRTSLQYATAAGLALRDFLV